MYQCLYVVVPFTLLDICLYFITKGLHYNFSTDSGPIAEDILLKHKKILSNIKDELLNYVIKQKEKLGNDNDFKQLLLKIGKEIKDNGYNKIASLAEEIY